MKKIINWFLVLVWLIGFGWPITARAQTREATLKVEPATASVIAGEVVERELKISSREAISYVKVSLTYSDNLEFLGYSALKSVFDTEVITSIVESPLRFERLRQDKGYRGSNGLIITLAFRAKSAGSALLSIDQASSELIAFKDSANILTQVEAATMTVTAESSSKLASAEKSTVVGGYNCSKTTLPYTVQFSVGLKDTEGQSLTGREFEPLAVIHNSPLAVRSVKKSGQNWLITITNVRTDQLTVTLQSKSVNLGQHSIVRSENCFEQKSASTLLEDLWPLDRSFPESILSSPPESTADTQRSDRLADLVISLVLLILALLAIKKLLRFKR